MLFEHRNKKYGAYRLRAEIGYRYIVSLAFIGIIFLCVAVPQLIYSYLHRNCPPANVEFVGKLSRFEGIRIKEARPERRPPHTVASDELSTGEESLGLDLPEKKEMAAITRPEDITFEPERIKDLPIDSMHVLEEEARLELAKGEEQTEGIIMDSIPHYPEGVRALMKWLDRNVVYPAEALRNHLEGTVEVAFIVEPDGSLTDPRILKGAYPSLENEALRVVRVMPHWLPASRNGKPIRSQVVIPIVFEMSN